MKVKDIMTAEVVSTNPRAKVLNVADLLFKNRFHGMPVVEDEKVVGMITENDFFTKGKTSFYLPSYIKFLKEAKITNTFSLDKEKSISQLLNARVEDIMTSGCVSVGPEMDVEELLEIMKKTKFNTIPVTDPDKKLRGIVTLMDVIGLSQSRSDFGQIAERDPGLVQDRQVDELVQNIDSWWKRSFILMRKTKVRTLKGVFIIAFIAGMAAAMIWALSVRMN